VVEKKIIHLYFQSLHLYNYGLIQIIKITYLRKQTIMRKYQNFALLLCSLFFSLYSFAQQPLNQINILSFSVKNKMPAEISTWGTTPGGLILTAQRIPQSAIQGVKLVVQIKQGGTKIYGNPVDASPILDFNAVKTFTGSELSGYITNGNTLKPGNYSVCAQFFNLDRYPISKETCKEFVVEDVAQTQQNYSPPQNINPGNGKIFKSEDLKGPVTFRWTPVIPKPRDPITYRLKVWQLMQGQNGTAAIKANQPIVEKDVQNIIQATVANIYTSPCKPPYMCDFVWNVQALDKDGKPVGGKEGMSASFSFSVSDNTDGEIANTPTNCVTPVINLPENGEAFNKDIKTIEIKGVINGDSKNLKLRLFKISDDPNLVNDLKQKSKAVSFFSPLEMFDYSNTAKKINASPKNYDVKMERSANNATGFAATIPTADLEHGSYYVIVQNGICESTPMAFSMSAGCGTNTDAVTITCKDWVNGLPTYNVSIVFTNIPSTTGGQNCTTQMNSITLPSASGTISTPVTLPTTIPSGGSSPMVTFTFTPATASQTNVSFNYFGIWNDGYSNSSNFGSGSLTLPSCVCNDCKNIQWNNTTTTSALTGNNFNVTQNINAIATGLGSIVSAKAEIIAFERYVGDSCVGCNKDYKQWGNFTSATYAGNNGSLGNANSPVTGNTTHSMYWNAAGGGTLPSNSSFNLNISTPALTNLACCCDRVAVTIRYTFSFKDPQTGMCKMCSFIKRYEKKKGNCPNTDTPIDVIDNPAK